LFLLAEGSFCKMHGLWCIILSFWVPCVICNPTV
jgi:hypothetical protein